MRRERGYTLLELLVALSAAGLLCALLAMVAGNLLGDVRERLRRQGVDEKRSVALRMMTELLNNAIVPDPRTGEYALAGSESEAVFFATPPQSLADMGLVRVRLHHAPLPSGQWALDVQLEAVNDPRRTAVRRLVTGPRPARLGYLDQPGNGPMQTHWRNDSRLPARVELEMPGDSDMQGWRLSVAPRRSVHGRCGFDSVSLSCR